MKTDVEGRRCVKAERILGEPGLWVFIAGDMFVFTVLFIHLLAERANDPAAFIAGQETLNRTIGFINTLLLLTSSLFVAHAARRTSQDDLNGASTFLIGAVVCGLGFVALKITEYHEKAAAGFGLSTSDFHAAFFSLTGVHLLHVLIGLGVLIFTTFRSREPIPEKDRAGYVQFVEGGGVFWHLVDLLWVALFTLFYLIR